jgi:hypothetical protein
LGFGLSSKVTSWGLLRMKERFCAGIELSYGLQEFWRGRLRCLSLPLCTFNVIFECERKIVDLGKSPLLVFMDFSEEKQTIDSC